MGDFPACHVSLPEGTLPETNISPENGWLENKPFLLGSPTSNDRFLLLVVGFGRWRCPRSQMCIFIFDLNEVMNECLGKICLDGKR